MHIHIDRERKTIQSEFSGKARDLLAELNINAETVVITRNGELITEQDSVGGDDEVKIISVVSGG